MRVPKTGQPLDERRTVREGKAIAERMLAGYKVTRNGRFVRDTGGDDFWAAIRPALAAWFGTPPTPARRAIRIWK